MTGIIVEKSKDLSKWRVRVTEVLYHSVEFQTFSWPVVHDRQLI